MRPLSRFYPYKEIAHDSREMTKMQPKGPPTHEKNKKVYTYYLNF